MGQAEVELCHYLADADDYVPVACSVHPDAITGGLLIFVVIIIMLSHHMHLCCPGSTNSWHHNAVRCVMLHCAWPIQLLVLMSPAIVFCYTGRG